MCPDTLPQGRHDAVLGEIMEQEGNDVRAFLNVVFGFLSRRCPEEVFGSGGGGGGHIAGQHLVNQSFCRWRQQYQEQRAEEELQKVMLREKEGVPEPAVEEVVSTSNHMVEGVEESSTSGSSPLHSTSPGQPMSTHRQGDAGSKAGSCGYLDTTNGAVLDGLAWTQSIDDLEVQVVVPSGVTRGKQVRVAVKQSSLAVSVQDGGSAWRTLLDGTLAHPVRAEECLWSLVSAEHVAIHLEKIEECWWDRLLTQHNPIDLQKISAEREYGSLPEEDRSKIQEMMWSRWQKDQGKPTSDQLRMESVLREAWTAEGSPFQGQPFDPSSVTVVGGQGFGAS
ncbi:nudC domain-containing protein 3-like isoform X2 [Portunus trituberculatus]|uniref:nudC domain-containing protein 3-like isoform X2 n=1 Tax=Portunus trituberculatus TaxID=210409 RepID=UPI001E1D0092|nr:nudC domain-containing protein 3-like isoform X2 [Portunus trituberculatus]